MFYVCVVEETRIWRNSSPVLSWSSGGWWTNQVRVWVEKHIQHKTQHDTDQTSQIKICLRLSRTSEDSVGPEERRAADGQTGGDRQRQERYRRLPGWGQTQVCVWLEYFVVFRQIALLDYVMLHIQEEVCGTLCVLFEIQDFRVLTSTFSELCVIVQGSLPKQFYGQKATYSWLAPAKGLTPETWRF